MTIPDLIHRKHQLKAELSEIELIVDAAAMRSERAYLENEPAAFFLCKETTSRLLEEFWQAPDKILSKEDIRQDVIQDEESSDEAVKSVIKRARKEMQEKTIPYTIKTIFRRGYQLVEKTQTGQRGQEC